MNGALRLVIRAISAHLIGKARLRQVQARTGSVTLVQRFGGALNLNIHFHMMFLDGVYDIRHAGRPRFVPVPAPTGSEMAALVQRISERVGRHLERRGLLVRDAESAWLEFDAEQASPLDDLAGHSITYRVAVGPNQGRKAFTLQTLPAWEDDGDGHSDLATAGGFSLHAGVAARANERDKIERLCRYIARPALASSRLSLTREGLVRYAFKTPWRDGTTHVLFEPLDFIARLATLIPRPGVNLTRYHGVLAPNSALRALVTPARRGKRVRGNGALTEPEKRRAMTWARRLKRVFRVDIEKCVHCGGAVKIIACIRDPGVIRRILDHLERRKGAASGLAPQTPRAPQFVLCPDGALDLD